MAGEAALQIPASDLSVLWRSCGVEVHSLALVEQMTSIQVHLFCASTVSDGSGRDSATAQQPGHKVATNHQTTTVTLSWVLPVLRLHIRMKQ